MGSIVSSVMSSNVPDPVTGLTPKEQKMITNTWNLVQKESVSNGIELFMIFFKNHPNYQNMFPFRDIPYDELREHKRLHIHATSVMYALNSIVQNLSNSEVLINLLIKNGMSHGERGVEEQAYWDLKESFLELLVQELGNKATEECLEAWNKCLDVAFKVATEHLKTDDLEEMEEQVQEEVEPEQQPEAAAE